MTDRKVIGIGSAESRKGQSEGHDNIFAEEKPIIEDFKFGKETASVFDDMVDRSVPFYREIQRMSGEIAADFGVPGTNLYDDSFRYEAIDNTRDAAARKAQSSCQFAGRQHLIVPN